MSSSLLISNGDVPYNSLWVSPSVAADLDLNEYNLIGGPRYAFFKFGTAATSNSVRFDLGTGTTKACNHLIISYANLLIGAGCTTLTLAGGSDGSTFGTTAYTNSSFASATLYGPHSNDLLVEFNATIALEWWKLSYSGSSSVSPQSTVSFGSAFDFGIDLDQYKIDRIPPQEAYFIANSGAQYQSRTSEEVYKFTFTWTKLTSSTVQTFMNTIGRFMHKQPVFFYTPAVNARFELLDNQRIVQCMITSIKQVKEFTNTESITIEATEVVG